jgi:zinc/manganese transport system substrate-binding protein
MPARRRTGAGVRTGAHCPAAARPRPAAGRWSPVVAVVVLTAGLATACGSGGASAVPRGQVAVVAAENQYGNVASQIGGRYVHVVSVESNPNADPHNYELSPGTAAAVAGAALVIQNGAGYDSFMNKLESASPSRHRQVIDVQHLLRLPADIPNPHLWYKPSTMPAVAQALTSDLARRQPAHAGYFRARAAAFDKSLDGWYAAIAAFRRHHQGATAATTEPVADYLLAAMGIRNLTPFTFQADVMNGTDPPPTAIALVESVLDKHRVGAFVYNEQVVDSLTSTIRAHAIGHRVPVVAVYETMPAPGFDYQSWMLAETRAISGAFAAGRSTLRL